MPYLTEAAVKEAARGYDTRSALREAVSSASAYDTFNVFLCHSIRDANLVLGAKKILEKQGLKVYVDWIVDEQFDRSKVSANIANILRQRMKQSQSLLYMFSHNSSRSRWMPWELGYFDGYNGTVGILPIVPDVGSLDFSQEEYLGLYPKVELVNYELFVNRTSGAPIGASASTDYLKFERWVSGAEKLKL